MSPALNIFATPSQTTGTGALKSISPFASLSNISMAKVAPPRFMMSSVLIMCRCDGDT